MPQMTASTARRCTVRCASSSLDIDTESGRPADGTGDDEAQPDNATPAATAKTHAIERSASTISISFSEGDVTTGNVSCHGVGNFLCSQIERTERRADEGRRGG